MFKIIGTVVTCSALGDIEIRHDTLIAVDDSGLVSHFDHKDSDASQELLSSSPTASLIEIPKLSFILPTFCDLHLHAPQFLYQGTGLHLPLMQWLDQYAFKAEERIDGDPLLARKVYESLASRLIKNGTGAVVLFGTIQENTNLILADAMQNAGIRAYVGKLSMDKSTRPTYKEDTTATSLSSARSFIRRLREQTSAYPVHRRLVEPVITPRFVPTCTDELLAGLGDLSIEEDVHIQSHLAEAHDQVEWVRQERHAEDIEVFRRSNLLTPRTIQAHCTFLDTPSLQQLQISGTSVAHCPVSNAYFSSEPFKLREALDNQVKVGLGTDIAGGYSSNIMDAMRQAVIVSRMRPGEETSVNWIEALYLATTGGAQAIGLPEGFGSFRVGTPFDAQLISIFNDGKGIGPMDFPDVDPPTEITEEIVEKWWCIGDDRNRKAVWVQGSSLDLGQ